MKAAHQSNLAEIAAGEAAQQSATTDDVTSLGAMFIQMHTQLDDSLKAAAQQLDVELPETAVLGLLDDYPTRSGYVITPVVMWGGGRLAVGRTH